MNELVEVPLVILKLPNFHGSDGHLGLWVIESIDRHHSLSVWGESMRNHFRLGHLFDVCV
jgi:hypothetical protein